jgi:Protein of unknown function (DUF2750)
MLWPLGEGEDAELFALPAEDRALQFFQLVADWEEAWGLKDADGWVVDKESDSLPLWPHAALADACAARRWPDATPEPVPLDDLLIDLLPLLAADHLRVAVFPAPDHPGLLLSAVDAADRLERELQITE